MTYAQKTAGRQLLLAKLHFISNKAIDGFTSLPEAKAAVQEKVPVFNPSFCPILDEFFENFDHAEVESYRTVRDRKDFNFFP